jgi:hypothetical protein
LLPYLIDLVLSLRVALEALSEPVEQVHHYDQNAYEDPFDDQSLTRPLQPRMILVDNLLPMLVALLHWPPEYFRETIMPRR